jgi:hypothetical protein
LLAIHRPFLAEFGLPQGDGTPPHGPQVVFRGRPVYFNSIFVDGFALFPQHVQFVGRFRNAPSRAGRSVFSLDKPLSWMLLGNLAQSRADCRIDYPEQNPASQLRSKRVMPLPRADRWNLASYECAGLLQRWVTGVRITWRTSLMLVQSTRGST